MLSVSAAAISSASLLEGTGWIYSDDIYRTGVPVVFENGKVQAAEPLKLGATAARRIKNV